MTCELPDIVSFLQNTPPFNGPAGDAAQQLAQAAEVQYCRKGQTVLEVGIPNEHLYLVRSGAVELFEGGEVFAARLDEGSFFAYPSLLRQAETRNAVKAVEDTLLYRFPAETFRSVRKAQPDIEQFFHSAEADRLHSALLSRAHGDSTSAGPSPMDAPIGGLITRTPITAPAAMTCRDGARRMTEAGVSTLLILSETEDLIGIVSDKDIRGRLVSAGKDPALPLSTIMTPDPICFPDDFSVIDALLAMMEGHFRHAPVVDSNRQLVGLVSGTDLMHHLAASGVQTVRSIMAAETTEDLAKLADHQRRMIVDLRQQGLSALRIAAMVSATGRAIHRRAYDLAVSALGKPPIPAAFVVFGSLARAEQTALSDQDNGLILADTFSETEHGEYFMSLAAAVSDTLNECGYVYCGGDIMATNDKWRQPLAGWVNHFKGWTQKPDPKAVMHSSIFFDMTFIAGDEAIADQLSGAVRDLTRKNGIFLAQMTENALKSKPPLGFFRQFVVSRHGEEDQTFDIKKEGMVPLQDLARVHALGEGIAPISTINRLETLAEKKTMNATDVQELKDAYAFLMDIRLAHQADQIARGEAPTNYINPQSLSRFEREHLRAAFKLIEVHQDGLSRKFAGGYF